MAGSAASTPLREGLLLTVKIILYLWLILILAHLLLFFLETVTW